MKKMFPFVILLLSLFFQASGQTSMVKGIVFEDVNRNGKREAGEKGIPGVSVSNSREVVSTDAGGRYELPVGDDNIIFVIKPSGYSVRWMFSTNRCSIIIISPRVLRF